MNLREAAQQALEALEIANNSVTPQQFFDAEITALRAALAEDAMQRLTDVKQEMDCYGDGNVYRGQRSSDSKTPTLTIKDNLTVEPVAWLIESYDIYAKRTLQRLVFDKPENMHGVKITAYYTAPPKRKPLTEEEITRLWVEAEPGPEAFARAIERAHGIGGEE